MSKDIHKWSDGRYTLMFDEHTFFVWDNEKDERMTALQTTKRLNEQQDIIFKLQDFCGKSDGENAKIRIENKRLQQEKEKLIAKIDFLERVIDGDINERETNRNHISKESAELD